MGVIGGRWRGRATSVAAMAALAWSCVACGGGGAAAVEDVMADVEVSAEVETDAGATCGIAADCDQEPCRLAACLAGRCHYVNRPDGAACDDGQECTSGDRCLAGACEPTATTCAPSCEVEADCPAVDPNDLCRGRAACVEGTCRSDRAAAVVCEPTLASCREVACEPSTGGCVERPAADGGSCDADDPCSVTSCQDGACVETGDSPCECRVDADCVLYDQGCADHHGCNRDVFPHVCQPLAGSALVCDDPEPDDCLDRACDPEADACIDVPLADASPCDDGDPCTLTSCAQGACVEAAPSPCECRVDGDCADDGDACNGHLVCDTSHVPYACVVDAESIPAPCDAADDSTCHHAVCDPASGECVVAFRAEGQACVPEEPCTIGAVCQAGACVGSWRDCDDADPCTDDACQPLTGLCDHAPVSGLVLCEDPAPCNVGGKCVGGLCLGTPRNCDDSNACTLEACDKADGACKTTLLTGPDCDDGLRCTVGDVCDEGVCGGTEVACDDDNGCTSDTCDAGTGACVFTPLVGAPCDDGNACTLGDACDAAGACVPASTTVCTAKGLCWHERCNPAPGNGNCEAEADPEQQGQPCYAYGTCGFEARCEESHCVPTLFVGTCCEQAGDCDDDDACTLDDCVAHRCTHDALVCDPAEVGCAFTPCEAGACVAPITLGSRRVLFDRTPGEPAWWQAAYASVEGAFTVEGSTLRLSGVVASAVLTLPPVRVPRGTSTLRLRVVGPADVPASLALTAYDTSVFPSQPLTVRAIDLDDQPGFDVLVDLSVAYDRTRRVSLAVSSPDLALGRVQMVHHGGGGCPGSLESSAGFPFHDTVAYATACTRSDGAVLAAWLEAKTGTEAHVGWAVRDVAGAWGARQVDPTTITAAGSTFRIVCIATGSGWALAYGSFTHDGTPGSQLATLDLAGVRTSSCAFGGVDDDVSGAPALARLPGGGNLLAYAHQGTAEQGWDVLLHTFAEDDAALTTLLQANQIGPGDQRAPALAVGDDRVLVAWEEVLGTDPAHLKRRLFATDLTPLVPESMFAGSADVTYRYPSAVALPAADGDRFLVVYEAKGKASDAGRGVYRSEITAEGIKVVNEVPLSDVLAGDQMAPFASPIPGGAAIVWGSNDLSTVDLMLSRFDAAGLHPNVRLASGVIGFGAVVPTWPGALDALFWRPAGPSIARLGLACDAGLTDCATTPAGLCVDADAYLPATPACSGEGCSTLCP